MGEAWIDAVGDIVEAEAHVLTMGMRYCRRVFVSMVGATAQVLTASADLASSTVAATTERVERVDRSVADVMQESVERTARSSRRARRHEDDRGGSGTMLPAEAFDAFTVEQLDRVASSRNMDGYPTGGSKADKVEALGAEGIDLDSLSVDLLDRLAEANDVDGYPRSGTKREKVDALTVMIPEMSGR